MLLLQNEDDGHAISQFFVKSGIEPTSQDIGDDPLRQQLQDNTKFLLLLSNFLCLNDSIILV